ncbi:S-layer homology domain-containing protein [Paenibacillus sp. HWE-109]|uniref:S-layer homology domain-containing protein n=1 Tax=Paenibacillus sp. HWE-109 TaxID=1306526 RepID=UPI001EE0495F|nr:S-layer homology domain-containing protein [Paenibacillus sp. HWE-109]UKS27220.1 S-layer homology domain-containing protein [Paenibacillus sp. HWE-109]
MFIHFKKVLIITLATTVVATSNIPLFGNSLTASAAIIPSDYALHMLFEDNLTDSSQNLLTATPVGGLSYAPGRIGSALNIDSSSASKQYVNLGKPDQLQFGTGTSFTLAFWVKSNGVSSDPPIISNKDWDGGSNVGYVVALKDTRLIWNYNTDGGSRADASIPNVADGAWHHIVISHDRATGRVDFYKDGNPVTVDITSGSNYNNISSAVNITGRTGTLDSGLSTMIGNDGTGNYSANLTARLDDFQILRKAVTAQEVLDAYNAIPPRDPEKFNGALNLIGAQHTVQGSQFHYNLDLRTPDMNKVIDKADVELAYDSHLFEFVSASRATSIDTSVPGILKLSLPGGIVYSNINPLEFKNSRISELIFKAKAPSGQGTIEVKNADFYNGTDKIEIESLNKPAATVQIHSKASEDLNKDGHVTVGDVVLAQGNSDEVLQKIADKAKFTPYKRVVVIGIDGGGVSVSPNAPYWETPNSVKVAVGSRLNIPSIRNIIDHGAISYTVKTTLPSSSSPNWGAMISGVDYSKHKIGNDISEAYTYDEASPYPTFFKKVRSAMPETKLAAFLTWNNIFTGHIEPSVGVEDYPSNDEGNAAAFAQYIADGKAADASVIFIHLDDMDHEAGHIYGFYTKKYYDQLAKTDLNVGVIYNALKDNQLLDDTLILMLPDHGGGTENANHTLGSSTSHGQDSPLSTTTFMAANGRTVAADVGKEKLLQGGTTKDLAATVLTALGIDPAIGDSKVIDGMFIQQKNQHKPDASNLKLTKVVSSTTQQLKRYELSIGELKSDAKAMDLDIQTNDLSVVSVEPVQPGVKVLRNETANGVTRIILSSDTGIVADQPIVNILVGSQGANPSAALKDAMVADPQAKETMPNLTSAEKQESDIPVTSVEVTPANLSIYEGQTVELYAKVLPATASNQAVTWTTSDSSVAALESRGDKAVITGIKPGTATITATAADGNFTSQSTVTIQAKPVETTLYSIKLDGKTSLNIGQQDQTIVQATYSDNSVIQPVSGIVFSSTVPTVATVDSHGLVSALGVGTTVIGATYGGLMGQYTLTVTSSKPVETTLSSIKMNGKASLYIGLQDQTTVKAKYSDNSETQPVFGITFSSSAPFVASVNSQGLVSALGVGTTVIEATYGGLMDQYTLTVNSSSTEPDYEPAPTTPQEQTKPAEPAKPVEPTKPALPEVFNPELVKLDTLIKSMESKVKEAKKQSNIISFTDLPTAHWAGNLIHKFAAIGVVQGYENGTFEPDGKVTRAEFATLISRIFEINGEPVRSLTLNDLNTHWAKTVIEKLANLGILNGYEDSSFKPDATISRAEMVAIVSRIVNIRSVQQESTSSFADIASSFAEEQIKEASKAGIISGLGDGQFHPNSPATRAEALTAIMNILNLNPEIKQLLDSLK